MKKNYYPAFALFLPYFCLAQSAPLTKLAGLWKADNCFTCEVRIHETSKSESDDLEFTADLINWGSNGHTQSQGNLLVYDQILGRLKIKIDSENCLYRVKNTDTPARDDQPKEPPRFEHEYSNSAVCPRSFSLFRLEEEPQSDSIDQILGEWTPDNCEQCTVLFYGVPQKEKKDGEPQGFELLANFQDSSSPEKTHKKGLASHFDPWIRRVNIFIPSPDSTCVYDADPKYKILMASEFNDGGCPKTLISKKR